MMKIHLICLFLSASKQQKYPLHSRYPLDYFQFHEKQRTKQSLTFGVQSSKVTDESCEELTMEVAACDKKIRAKQSYTL